MSSDAILLPDDHVETVALRHYAANNRCAVIASYKGATMRYLFTHGASYVVGVEPQQWACDLAVKNLLDYGPCAWEIDTLALVPWDTAHVNETLLYNVGTDGANTLGVHRWLTEKDAMKVTAMNVREWLESYQENPDREREYAFDFMVVNIEGGEYALLPELAIGTRVLLVQYHGPPMPLAQVSIRRGFEREESIGKGWHLYT